MHFFARGTEPLVNSGFILASNKAPDCARNQTDFGRTILIMDDKKTDGRKVADTERKRRGDRLGEQLRRLYDDVTHENVPDDFLRLLEEADRSRSADSHNKSS
jgi:hypothetical protein